MLQINIFKCTHCAALIQENANFNEDNCPNCGESIKGFDPPSMLIIEVEDIKGVLNALVTTKSAEVNTRGY